MKKRLIILMILFLLNFFLFSYDYKRVVKKEISAKGINAVSVKNINGKIIISKNKGETVDLTAEIKGNTKEKIDLTTIIIKRDNDLLKIKPDFPSKNNISVDFFLSIPENLYLRISSVNGKILTDVNLIGFKISTVNGSISINSEYGKGKISTVNGIIKVYLKKVNGDMSLSAVNGGVSLFIKDPKNISLKASTVNGSVKIKHDSLKITYKKRLFPFSNFATIKARGEKPEFYVKISTVNGSIKVLPF